MESQRKISQSFAILQQFNQQITHDDFNPVWNASGITYEDHIIGQKDILEPMLSQFACEPTQTQGLTQTVLEALPGEFDRINIIVLMDSVQVETGFLAESVSEITQSYNRLLSSTSNRIRIKATRLEQDRQHIRDHGPILGLLCHNVLELKACFATHLKGGSFIRQRYGNYKKIAQIYTWLQSKAKKEHKNFFSELELLAFKQLQRKSRREMTPAMTKRLLHCNADSAEILSAAYQQLPTTPLGFRPHYS